VPNPEDLYQLDGTPPQLIRPVLLHGFDGFIDAGSAGQLVRDHILDSLEHRVVARFDVDQLIDYRARRPVMTYDKDHWAAYEAPEIVLRVVHDAADVPFLLLTGPEPDRLWEGFVAAVRSLIERLGVTLTVYGHGIPMGVPHTRPLGLTSHGSRPELVADNPHWFGRVEVPGSIAGLLELRLGESGRDAVGFAVHVPHYLSQTAYPAAAITALEAIMSATGLVIPADKLRDDAARTDADIAEQVADSEEVMKVVKALEQQYDAFAGSVERDTLLAQEEDMPTADELAAQFQRFLAEQDGPSEQ
jgi:predicted ATP-grasp superfamily ATP-dependent carboligase